MLHFDELENLRDRILKYPSQYRQEYWGYGKGSRVVKEQKPACGTAGCMAFNAVANHGYILSPFLDGDGETTTCRKNGRSFPIRSKATEILGLTFDQSEELFNGGRGGWSERAQDAYNDAKTPKARAAAAALAIDDFIAKYRAIEAYGDALIDAIRQ
jgi:hypothetical protein